MIHHPKQEKVQQLQFPPANTFTVSDISDLNEQEYYSSTENQSSVNKYNTVLEDIHDTIEIRRKKQRRRKERSDEGG